MRKIIQIHPSLYFFVQLIRPNVKVSKKSLQAVHDEFAYTNNDNTIAVDLGCGFKPVNRFGAAKSYGVDLYEDNKIDVFKCHLGFERLPFDDNSLDYLTAYDLLEHIPRYSDNDNCKNMPFIFLINECYRVLKKEGLFLSFTPIYPYIEAFSDPTHNNIMTSQTFEYYFSNKKFDIAKHYGITANFEIKYQGILAPHLIAVLKKV